MLEHHVTEVLESRIWHKAWTSASFIISNDVDKRSPVIHGDYDPFSEFEGIVFRDGRGTLTPEGTGSRQRSSQD
ncbi:hypothetical protein Trydic_g6310 [Trypoxylus dichotomus]